MKTILTTLLVLAVCASTLGAIPDIIQRQLKREATGKRYRVVPKTASYTIVADDTGTVFTNYGATGAVTFNLPVTDAKGLTYTFVVQAAQTVNNSGRPFELTQGLQLREDVVPVQACLLTGNDRFHIRPIPRPVGKSLENDQIFRRTREQGQVRQEFVARRSRDNLLFKGDSAQCHVNRNPVARLKQEHSMLHRKLAPVGNPRVMGDQPIRPLRLQSPSGL